MHIVLIRFSSLGDVILQTPLIAWIKFTLPNTRITYITSKQFSALVSNHPYIDDVLTIDRKKGFEDFKQLNNLSKKIKNDLKPDFIIDLHGTLRAKLIHLFCYSIPFIKVNKRSLFRSILIKFKIDFLKNLESHHERVINDFKFIFKREFVLDEIIDFNQRKSGLENIGLTSLPNSFENIKPIVEGEYIAISPIASFASKRWPMSHVRELIELVLKDAELQRFKIVIVAGPDDKYCDEIFNDSLLANDRLINLQGKTSIEESGIVLAKAKICITNDTGTGHITEAFGNPVITLFGPTLESFGFKPHLPLSKAMSVDLKCRPCSATGKKNCTRDKHYCMLDIRPIDVFTEMKKKLSEQVSL